MDERVEQTQLDAWISMRIVVYLSNGVALQGQLISHDDDVVKLTRPESSEPTIIYKDHITTIHPEAGYVRQKRPNFR